MFRSESRAPSFPYWGLLLHVFCGRTPMDYGSLVRYIILHYLASTTPHMIASFEGGSVTYANKSLFDRPFNHLDLWI